MPVLSSPTTWRTSPYSAEFYCAVIKPPVVFAARVNQVSFSYPLAEVVFDTVTTGAYTDVSAGLLVCFGSMAGASDLGRQRIRKAATSNTLYIGWSSQGVRDGEVNLSDNAYITIYNLRQVWAKTPRILDDGTIYKDFDIPYTEGIYPPPVANCGPGYAEFIDDTTGLITVNFSDFGSFATSEGSTISNRAWVFPNGTPSSSTATNPGNVTFPAGFRYVQLTVTDSQNKTHTAYAPIFGATKTGNNRPTRCEIVEHSRRAEGQRMVIKLHEDLPESDYPDGCLVMVWARERYGATAGSLAGPSGRQHMVFVGWIDTEQHRIAEARQGLTKDTSLTLTDVAGRLAKLPGFPQQISRKSGMGKWTDMQITSAPANIARFVHYILHWHSTAFELADFVWSGTNYPFTILNSDGQSLYNQADQRCDAIGYRLTCNAWGQLQMKPDPQLLATGERTSTVIVDLTEKDWTSIQYTHTRPPRNHWANGAALVISTMPDDTTFKPIPVFCRAPGNAPGQGLGSTSTNYQLVQTNNELYVREGNRYAARINAMQGEFRVDLARGGEAGIDPAEMEWVRLTVSSGNRFRRGLQGSARLLPIEISYDYDHRGGFRQASVVLEREASGTPAVDVPPPEANIEIGGWEVTIPSLEPIPPIDLGGTVVFNPVNETLIDPRPGKVPARGRFFGATVNGHVWRLVFPAGIATFENISPTADQRALLGTGIMLVADVHNFKKLWLYGQYAILCANDATASNVSWQVVHSIPKASEWSQKWDFTKSPGPWTPRFGLSNWSPGVGFKEVQDSLGHPYDLRFRVNAITVSVSRYVFYASFTFRGYSTTDNVVGIEFAGDAVPIVREDSMSRTGGKVTYNGAPRFDYWIHFIANCFEGFSEIVFGEMRGQGTNPWTGEGSTEEFISHFVSPHNRKNTYYWLSKITDGGIDYVYFNRTLDGFSTLQRTKVARYVANTFNYSIAVNAFNYRQIYVSAGIETAPSDAFIYKSVNGGNSFTKTSALETGGGALWWNFSTRSVNQKNTTDDNLLWSIGRDGSNNQRIARGLNGSPITVLTGSADNLGSPQAIAANYRDLDLVRYAAKSGKFRTSSNAGDTWASATDIPGGSLKSIRGWSQFPPDSNFVMAFGYRTLAYSLNAGTAWTDLWPGYNTFRTAESFGTDGEIIVSCVTDWSLRYPGGLST